MARSMVPAVGSDVLLHDKDTDRTERVVFPFTRYRNVMSAPNVITTAVEVDGAPFHVLKTGQVEVSEEDILDMCGDII